MIDLGSFFGQSLARDRYERHRLDKCCINQPKAAREMDCEAISWPFSVRPPKTKIENPTINPTPGHFPKHTQKSTNAGGQKVCCVGPGLGLSEGLRSPALVSDWLCLVQISFLWFEIGSSWSLGARSAPKHQSEPMSDRETSNLKQT